MGWIRRGLKSSASCGPAAVFAAIVGLAALSSPGQGSWTITGTTLQNDGLTPVPNVAVTVYPDSMTSVTDANGDFILGWSGQRGWLTIIPAEKEKDGREWCMRHALYPRTADADSTYDVGIVSVQLPMRVRDLDRPVPIGGAKWEPKFRVPGPKPGEPIKYWQMLRVEVDFWGRTSNVAEIQGSPTPASVHDALRAWLKNLRWTVQTESPCSEATPFWNTVGFSYVWQDSVWAPTPNLGPPVNWGPTTSSPTTPGATPDPSGSHPK